MLEGYFRCSFDGDNGALPLLINNAPQTAHFLHHIWHLLPHEHFFSSFKEAVKIHIIKSHSIYDKTPE